MRVRAKEEPTRGGIDPFGCEPSAATRPPDRPGRGAGRVPRGAVGSTAPARAYSRSIRVVHWTDLALALLVAGTGVLAAALTQAFDVAIQWLYRFHFGTLPALLSARGWPGWVPYLGVPALMGVVVAALKALVPPENQGHAIPEVIVSLLRREGRVPLRSTVLKTLAAVVTLGSGCSITLGSGWSGGMFAPAMYLGAMAGGAYGTVLGMLLPGRVGPPGAYAVVGMAAMIAGATQAPLTGMTLILEVTRDYQIALPAMLACGVASVFSLRLTPYSIDTLHLPEKGVVLPWQVQDLRGFPVREAMVTPVHTVRDDQVLGDVIQLMQRYHHDGYPVLNRQGRLVGIITLGDIRDVPLEGRLGVPVGQVMQRDLEVVTPDQSLADAALALARRGVGRLPVVDPDDPRRLLGIITRSDILRAYLR